MPDPDCEEAPGSRVDQSGTSNFCTFSFNDTRALLPNEERVSAYLHGEYDLTNHTNVFAEASIAKARTDYLTSPSFNLAHRPVLSANHVDNPFPGDALFIGRPLGLEAGGAVDVHDDDTLRAALGLQGDFGDVASSTFFEDWKWELFATYGVSRYRRNRPDTVVSDFDRAINSCEDASDLGNCYNPTYSAVLGTGTPNSDSVIDSFIGELSLTVDQYLQTYNGGLDGPLFALPGGDVGLAVGAEVRQEQRTTQLGKDANAFDLSFYFGDEDAKAERDVLSGYAELVWPVYPGVELQTAGRVEDYSDAGTTFNPSAGFMLQIAELAGQARQTPGDVSVKANISRAFRAPGLYQSFHGSTTVPASLDEGGPAPLYLPVRREGNPDLEPEKALAFSAGLGWDPHKVLHLSADYWRYNYEGYITPENAQKVLNDELASGMPDPRVERDESGALLRVTVPHVNVPGDIVVHGLDAAARITLDAGSAGEFMLGAETTYVFAFEIPREQIAEIELDNGDNVDLPFCDADTCDVAGNFNEANVIGPQPSLRLNVPLSWALSEHRITVALHFMGGLEDWAPSRYDEETGQRTIDSYATLDLQYALTLHDVIGDTTQLRIGAINLLDQDPPFVDVIDSFSTQLHDPRGRMVYASLSQEF